MDEVVVFLVLLIVAVAILWFLLKILVGTILIWGGVLIVVSAAFVWSLASKWSLLNSLEKASGLVTLSFDGGKVRWQPKEPAFQVFLETKRFAAIGIGLGIFWVIICTGFGLSHTSKGWGIFAALVLTPVAIPFIIKGYSSLMCLKILNRVHEAGYHLGRPNEIAILEGKIAATAKRMGFDFPIEFSKTLQSFVEGNAVALMSDLTPLESEIAKLETDASGVLASLEDAERDLAKANKAYDDAVPVVIQSRSNTLIQALEQMHKILNTTALSDFLATRQWHMFKNNIAEAIETIESLCKAAKSTDPATEVAEDDSGASRVMTRETALKILGLEDGCDRQAVEKAYVHLSQLKVHPNGREGAETSLLPEIDEIAKKLGEAKQTLLQTLKERA